MSPRSARARGGRPRRRPAHRADPRAGEQSNRAAIDFDGAAGGSLHPGGLLTFIGEPLRHRRTADEFLGAAQSRLLGRRQLVLARNMGTVYIGALPLVALLTLGVLRGGLLGEGNPRLCGRGARDAAVRARLVHAGLQARFPRARRRPVPQARRRDVPARRAAAISRAISCIASSPATGGRACCAAVEAGAVLLAFAACVLVAWKGQLGDALPVLGRRSCGSRARLPCCRRYRACRARTWRTRGRHARRRVCHRSRVNIGPNESTALPPSVYDVLRRDTQIRCSS